MESKGDKMPIAITRERTFAFGPYGRRPKGSSTLCRVFPTGWQVCRHGMKVAVATTRTLVLSRSMKPKAKSASTLREICKICVKFNYLHKDINGFTMRFPCDTKRKVHVTAVTLTRHRGGVYLSPRWHFPFTAVKGIKVPPISQKGT